MSTPAPAPLDYDSSGARTTSVGGAGSGSTVRWDLQGLRAVAVTGVVIYHLRSSWLPGGFAGVDVFFVLSGFFISGLLLREIQRTDRVALLTFWGRRARRLLPASILVLLATVVAGEVMTNPLEAHRIARDSMYAVFFGVNWHEAASGLAYGKDPDPSPFQHYWSLGVEEQFYLGWPLLILALVLIWHRRRTLTVQRSLIALGVVAGIASFALALHQTNGNQPYAYYGTFGRVWQLALGGMLAASITTLARLPGWLLGLARIAGIAMVLGFYIVAPGDVVDHYPGWWSMLPTLGAALVVATGSSGARRDPVGLVLASRPGRVIGNYSYSWYLWHWPPLVLLPIALGHRLNVAELIACALGSLVAAAATYHLLENPVRTNRWLAFRRGGRSLALGAALMVIAVGTAQWTLHESAYAAGHAHVVTSTGATVLPTPAAAAKESPRPVQDGCQVTISSDALSPDCRYLPNRGHGDIVLVGDSHAGMWFDAVDKLAAQRQWGLRVWARESCPFADIKKTVVPPNEYSACDRWRADIVDRLIADRPSLVIISSFATAPLHVNVPSTGAGARGQQAYDLYEAGMVRELTKLRAAKLHVLVIADVPGFPQTAPDCVLAHTNDVSQCSLPESDALPHGGVDEQAARKVPGVHTIDFTPTFCHGGRCYQVVGNILAYRDQNHLTNEMALHLEPQLASAASAAAR